MGTRSLVSPPPRRRSWNDRSRTANPTRIFTLYTSRGPKPGERKGSDSSPRTLIITRGFALGVVAGQFSKRVLSRPARPLGPSCDGADAGPIVDAGLGRSPRVREGRQGVLNPLGRHVRV